MGVRFRVHVHVHVLVASVSIVEYRSKMYTLYRTATKEAKRAQQFACTLTILRVEDAAYIG